MYPNETLKQSNGQKDSVNALYCSSIVEVHNNKESI